MNHRIDKPDPKDRHDSANLSYSSKLLLKSQKPAMKNPLKSIYKQSDSSSGFDAQKKGTNYPSPFPNSTSDKPHHPPPPPPQKPPIKPRPPETHPNPHHNLSHKRYSTDSDPPNHGNSTGTNHGNSMGTNPTNYHKKLINNLNSNYISSSNHKSINLDNNKKINDNIKKIKNEYANFNNPLTNSGGGHKGGSAGNVYSNNL